MRICHIAPHLLDTKGLIALWRETLLAQSSLVKNTKSWNSHPHLRPFKIQNNPLGFLSNYLHALVVEGNIRNYNLQQNKIIFPYNSNLPLITTSIEYVLQEWLVLKARYKIRSPHFWLSIKNMPIELHSSFTFQVHAQNELVSCYAFDSYFGI